VEIVLSHAGASGGLIDALVRERQAGAPDAVDGLVLAATGNGTLHRNIEEAAARAQAAGIVVWRASRCALGRMLPAGDAIPYAADLSPVKARIALTLWLAGRRP
jgi:L-asparaginase